MGTYLGKLSLSPLLPALAVKYLLGSPSYCTPQGIWLLPFRGECAAEWAPVLNKHSPSSNLASYTVSYKMLGIPHRFTHSFNDLIGICSLCDIFEDVLG